MTSFKKIVIFCDMWKHADLQTLGRFVWNRHILLLNRQYVMYPAVSVKVCRFHAKRLRVCKSACFFEFKYKMNEFLRGIALNE